MTVAVRIGRRPRRWPDRPREQLVVAEALEERRVVVVRAEDEAQLLDAGLALGVQDEAFHRRADGLRRCSPSASRQVRTPLPNRRVGSDARRPESASE